MFQFEVMNSYDEEFEDIDDYLERLENFFIANQVNDDDKVSTFVKFMDPRMYNILKTLVAPNKPEQMTMEQTEEVLKKHYAKKIVIIAERFKFYKRDQLENETIADYAKELRKLATTCVFGAFLEEAVRDKFVFGMKDETLQAALLKEDLTFDDTYKFALTIEMTAILQPDKIEHHKLCCTENTKRNEVKSEISYFEDFNYILEVKEEVQQIPFKTELEEQPEFVHLADEQETNLQFEVDRGLSTQSTKKKYICEYCQHVFSNNALLRRHLRIHTGEKPFSCITCRESFTRREGLQRHTKKSSACENYDKQKLLFQSNLKAKQKVKHICDYCNWSFRKKSHLQGHLRTHTGEKPYSCEICKISFSRSYILRKHLLTHGKEYCDQLLPKKLKLVKRVVEKIFKCQNCGQIFMKKSDLQQHLKSDSGVCKSKVQVKLGEDSGTATSESFNTEIDHLGMQAAVTELFKCDTCNYTTTKKDQMRRHVKIHSGIKPFLCHICDYKATRNSYLQEHIMRHEGIKNFPCSICDFKTVSQSKLKCHMKIHTGEKTHICEICGYKTRSGSWLKVHLRIHTGEKPYACNICNYRSVERTALRNHIRIHTGEKPFCCKFCDYRAAQRTGLTYHLKTHKKDKQVEQPTQTE